MLTRAVLSVLVVAGVLVAAAEGAGQKFIAVKPGGNTTCAHGGEYAFMFRNGTGSGVNKLAVFFEGGGACWDAVSCDLPIYTTSVDVQGELDGLNAAGSGGGILSQDPRSPIADWAVLYIPYCTGDCHAGVHKASYGVNHVGHLNTEVALDWVQSFMTNPEVVATLGCSAGSLGAFLNAPFIMNRWSKAQHVCLGDSEVGVLTKTQLQGAFDNWHLTLAPFIPKLAKLNRDSWFSTVSGEIVSAAADYFPQSTYAAYTSNADIVQGTFYDLGGGGPLWTTVMREEFTQAHGNATNVATYIAPGNNHCQTNNDAFWSVTSANVKLYEWATQVIQMESSLNKNVDCSPNCGL